MVHQVSGFFHSTFYASVVVPSAVIQVNETDTLFSQAAGKQAITGKGAVSRRSSVHVKHMLGHLGDIHEVGNAGLHTEGHFVLADFGGDLRVSKGAVA